MSDWKFAQKNVSEELAQLHYFSFKKCHKDGDVLFQITVKELGNPSSEERAQFLTPATRPDSFLGAYFYR